jgi:GT2 family glycosyltransferase
MKNAGKWIEIHRIIGFCMLIKKKVIDQVGMFDERFGPGGYEDYDLCLRVKQAGYKIIIAHDVFVYHFGGKGYSDNNLDYEKLRENNLSIFIDKWCEKVLKIMDTNP